MTEIYKHIYDNPKNADGTDKPNELLGEYEIVFGDINDYSFSVIGISKADGLPYNIIGDEVSGRFGSTQAGTRVSINPIILQRPHVA